MSNNLNPTTFDRLIFAQRLRNERKRLKLSQQELADIGGVSRATQINYEAGTHTPDAKYLYLLSANGFQITYLFYELDTGVLKSVDVEIIHRLFTIVDSVSRDRWGNLYDANVRATIMIMLISNIRLQDIREIDWIVEKAKLVRSVRGKLILKPDGAPAPSPFDSLASFMWS